MSIMAFDLCQIAPKSLAGFPPYLKLVSSLFGAYPILCCQNITHLNFIFRNDIWVSFIAVCLVLSCPQKLK